MTVYFDHYENAANDIIKQVGRHIVIGIPLGLGKPIGLINALYQLACHDPTIELTIFTGLTLARPPFNNELEKRFVEPILDRLLGNYEDLLYEKAREKRALPANINVIEFFLMPGKYLHDPYVQQNYISTCYTSAVRDVMNLSMNVYAQAVAPSDKHTHLYSLSCNSDLFHDVHEKMSKAAAAGNKIAIIAEVNANLPYMYGDVAEVDANLFTAVVDTKAYRSLFAVPRDELSVQDHLIGLYTSCLIKDNGCLQIGIGKLSNSLANALIFRHKQNDLYHQLLDKLEIKQKFGNVILESTALGTFEKGLYASTEMLSDEYMQLFNEDILKKRVYDNADLQRLLNEGKITESVTPEMIAALIENKVVDPVVTPSSLAFLKTFGILKSDIHLENNHLILESGEVVSANLTTLLADKNRLSQCLGSKLKTGKIIHAGFFLGSTELYAQLHNMPYSTAQQIEMTSINRTNLLSWSPELLRLQRQHARFVNSALMITLLGEIVSDGLQNYDVISGVGGQYDFVSMSMQLHDARSIITCRSTRTTKNGVVSNMVWDYANSTLPRYLRDIVITEYGIADCRSKTDADVIKALLNITDSRFQNSLLMSAKENGKLPRDYQIPVTFRNNTPKALENMLQIPPFADYFKPYPFGSDLTPTEQALAKALMYLKNCTTRKLLYLVVRSLFHVKSDAQLNVYLQRMQLDKPHRMQDLFYKKLLIQALRMTMPR